MEVTFTDLCEAWDKLNAACQAMSNAQTHNLTVRAAELDDARRVMASRMNQFMRTMNYRNMD